MSATLGPYFRAEIRNGEIRASGPDLKLGEAVAIVRIGDDVIAKSSNLARDIALLAGGGKTPIGPEKHASNRNIWPRPHPSAFRWHYHTADRNGAHVFF